MVRHFLVSTALLLCADVSLTTTASVLGAPVCSEANAADFRGRIRRIRIRERVNSTSYHVVIDTLTEPTVFDGGIVIRICDTLDDCASAAPTTLDAIDPRYIVVFDDKVSYAGAMPPEGAYDLTAVTRTEDGSVYKQAFVLLADGDRLSVEAVSGDGPVSDITFTANDCGTGTVSAEVSELGKTELIVPTHLVPEGRLPLVVRDSLVQFGDADAHLELPPPTGTVIMDYSATVWVDGAWQTVGGRVELKDFDGDIVLTDLPLE